VPLVVPLGPAIGTSLAAVAANPGAMVLWDVVVMGVLALGCLPALDPVEDQIGAGRDHPKPRKDRAPVRAEARMRRDPTTCGAQ